MNLTEINRRFNEAKKSLMRTQENSIKQFQREAAALGVHVECTAAEQIKGATMTTTITFAAIENAQQARRAMQDAGWLPLCKINDGEHWSDGCGRHAVLVYDGDVPGKAELIDAKFVRFQRLESGQVIAL